MLYMFVFFLNICILLLLPYFPMLSFEFPVTLTRAIIRQSADQSSKQLQL